MSSSVMFQNLWNKFKDSPTDAVLVEISRSIDEIIGEFDENVDYSKLYSPLCQLIGDNNINSHLLAHALTLSNKIVGEAEKRQEMVEVFLPAISHQILYRYKQQPSDTVIKLCLESLKLATYDVVIRTVSNHPNQLLHLLVKLIIRKDAALLNISLAVLANLCRNNLVVQTTVKCMDCIRALYSSVMKLLGSDNTSIIVHSLSLFTTLALHENLGRKFFVDSGTETYQLVVNILTSNTDNADTQIYSLNILIDFTKSDTMFATTLRYKNMKDLLEKLINVHLPDSSPLIRDKVCEFLRCLATKDELFEKIATILKSDETLNVSRYLIENIRSVRVLSLLHVLIPDVYDNSEECRNSLVAHLLHNLENIPLHVSGRQCYKVVVLSCQCLSVLHQDSLYSDIILSKAGLLPSVITSWLDSAPDPYDTDNRHKFSIEACRALVELTNLCMYLGHSEYRLVLAHPHISYFIGLALLSQDSSLIEHALTISSLCAANSETYSSSVSNILSHQLYQLNNKTYTVQQELDTLQQKYNELERQKTRYRELEEEEKENLSPNIAYNSQINDLIEQMRDGMQVEDLKASQLLEIFQEKIAIMTTKEEHLNDLVDAKTMALQQSDRLFTQFKNRVAQAEKECSKYRLLLQNSEREAEVREEEMCVLEKELKELIQKDLKMEKECSKYRVDVEEREREKDSMMTEIKVAMKQKDGLMSEVEEMKNKYTISCCELKSLKEQYNEMTNKNSEFVEKLEGYKDEIEMLTVQSETLKSQHDCDVNQIQVLQKEKQKVVVRLEEKDSLYLKTKQSLRQSDKEKLDFESQLIKKSNEFSKLETRQRDLEEKEKVLGCKISEKDRTIETQKCRLNDQTQEIEKYKQLMAMFHNLSSGTTEKSPKSGG